MIKGYKVFNPDWTCAGIGRNGYYCKKYSCPGKFEEEGEPKVCIHGMHFCEKLADCFNHYTFNSDNKVAEVIAYGKVVKDEGISCTDELEIIREIPWDEVLRIVNIGRNCTGCGNTGNYNAGDCNTGGHNTGDCNTGNRNTGNFNTGSKNVGNYNTGNRNTGNYNTGNYNTGDYNTGSMNTGSKNIGDSNVGSCNIGDWNKTSFNTGCFNTEEQKFIIFNKPSDWTYEMWLYSKARYLLNQIPKDVVEWIHKKDMTDKEKMAHPTYETTGGYLKILDESECAQLWWNNLSDNEKQIIKSIPNFNADIFYECTGIKTD